MAKKLKGSSISLQICCSKNDLEKERHKILAIYETSWRLKRRALWLKEGDRNKKFYHRFANNKREINSIWEIKAQRGVLLHSEEEIS